MNTSPDMPSGRPMTLRQQLKDLLGTDLHEGCGDECGDKERFNKGIEAIERWCQEIAREARSDLTEAIVSNSIHTTGNKHSGSPNGTDTFTIDKTKLWELTQKPPHPTNHNEKEA